MPPRLAQFVDDLQRSGLLAASDLRSFLQSFPSERRPKDASALASELVRSRRLTRYQVQTILQGKTEGLVYGDYRVLDRIGQGGMGVVYKAEHRLMRRVVALKVLLAQRLTEPEAVQRFYHEVEVAARLTHPNVVAAYDAREEHGTHYLVMEYVQGRSLSQIVRQQGMLPVEQAVDCILQAARGLAYAHRRGVVHRDIKPGNLLVDQSGTVKVLDLGLARMLEEPGSSAHLQRLTRTGQVMGTCDYMAPEQATDSRQADARSDIYSLGCTLFRLLTGEPPYPHESLMEILWAHREEPVPALQPRLPEAPPKLEAILQRMMAKRPEDRYQTMQDVIGSLEPFLREYRRGRKTEQGPGASTSGLSRLVHSPRPFEEPSSVATATTSENVASGRPSSEASAPWQRQRRRVVVVIAVLALMLIAGLTWALLAALRRGRVLPPGGEPAERSLSVQPAPIPRSEAS